MTGATTAAVRGERILALAAVVARICAVPMLAGVVLGAPLGRLGPLLGVAVFAAAEAAAYAIVCGRRGVVTPAWAALDTAATAAVFAAGEWFANDGGPVERTYAYNYMMIAVIAVGLARWPVWAALAAAVVLAATSLATGLAGAQPWNAVPDALDPIGVALVGAVVATLLRTAHRQVDAYRDQAVDGARALATERERLRQAQALRGPLLSTLEDLAAGEAIAGPVIRDQLRTEVAWLREVVASGLVSAPSALGPGLRQVAAEKSAAGMRLRLELPAAEPALDPAGVEALVEAAREALTNVAKHAGTAEATVSVSTVDDGVAVVVSDTGRGYDPATTSARLGVGSSILRRVAEAGGVAEISSAPGRGTRVRLWVPSVTTPREDE